MPTYKEFEGKNLDKVTEKASKKLKIPVTSLKYKVISYGSSGIFGLVGNKKAKIRVTLPKNFDKVDVSESPPATEAVEASAVEDKIEPNPEPLMHNIQEAIDTGKEMLQKILAEIAGEATFDVQQEAERISFNIQNDNAAIIIGKRGQTLEAIQYLVEKSINRQHKSRLHIQVDIEGYFENRQNNLKQTATRMAKKVKRTGKPVTVGQMNAHDRRIVHLALKHDQHVRTQSMGDGFYRKLVIFPKKTASTKTTT